MRFMHIGRRYPSRTPRRDQACTTALTMENRNAITALTVRDAHTFLPAALPSLVLDEDEAVALAIGLRHGTGRDRRIEGSSERALANIVRIIPHICVDALCAMTSPATWSTVPNVDAAARVDLQTTTSWGLRATRSISSHPDPCHHDSVVASYVDGVCQSGRRRTACGRPR